MPAEIWVGESRIAKEAKVNTNSKILQVLPPSLSDNNIGAINFNPGVAASRNKASTKLTDISGANEANAVYDLDGNPIYNRGNKDTVSAPKLAAASDPKTKKENPGWYDRSGSTLESWWNSKKTMPRKGGYIDQTSSNAISSAGSAVGTGPNTVNSWWG